jgi:hypothetical protein
MSACLPFENGAWMRMGRAQRIIVGLRTWLRFAMSLSRLEQAHLDDG